MRSSRRSRSFNLIVTGSSGPGVLAQPAIKRMNRTPAALNIMLPATMLRCSIDVRDFDTAILGPGCLIAALHGRPFFAKAHCRDLAFVDPEQHEGAPHRLRTPLAEANV